MQIYISALIASVVVFIANYIGIQGAYASVYGYDNLVHFLGGVAIGICIFVAAYILKERWLRTFAGVLICVIIVGLLWEFFEAYFKIAILPGQTYWPDTIRDMCMDAIGGVVAYRIFRKKAETFISA